MTTYPIEVRQTAIFFNGSTANGVWNFSTAGALKLLDRDAPCSVEAWAGEQRSEPTDVRRAGSHCGSDAPPGRKPRASSSDSDREDRDDDDEEEDDDDDDEDEEDEDD